MVKRETTRQKIDRLIRLVEGDPDLGVGGIRAEISEVRRSVRRAWIAVLLLGVLHGVDAFGLDATVSAALKTLILSGGGVWIFRLS